MVGKRRASPASPDSLNHSDRPSHVNSVNCVPVSVKNIGFNCSVDFFNKDISKSYATSQNEYSSCVSSHSTPINQKNSLNSSNCENSSPEDNLPKVLIIVRHCQKTPSKVQM